MQRAAACRPQCLLRQHMPLAMDCKNLELLLAGLCRNNWLAGRCLLLVKGISSGTVSGTITQRGWLPKGFRDQG